MPLGALHSERQGVHAGRDHGEALEVIARRAHGRRVGLPGYEAMPWLGLEAPTAMSPAVVSRLHHELAVVLKEPEVQEKFRSLGLDIIGSTPKEVRALLRKDIVKWAKVVKDSGAKAD